LPEVAGAAGLMVAPDDIDGLADAMARVIASDSLRAEMRANGMLHAATFTWDRMARATKDTYEKALALHAEPKAGQAA